jgi:hypothetical protein
MEEERLLFISDKNEYGNSIIVRKKDKVICKTFVNFSKNWFDIPQQNDYWFSMLIFDGFHLNEVIYSNRAEYYLEGELITNMSILKKNLKDINNFIFSNLKSIIIFIENDYDYMYFENIN